MTIMRDAVIRLGDRTDARARRAVAVTAKVVKADTPDPATRLLTIRSSRHTPLPSLAVAAARAAALCELGIENPPHREPPESALGCLAGGGVLWGAGYLW